MNETREMSRRGLLAAAGAVSLPLWGAAKRTSKMKFGFTSYQWGKQWDLPTLIRVCTES